MVRSFRTWPLILSVILFFSTQSFSHAWFWGSIGNIFEDIGDALEDIFEDIGDTIEDIFTDDEEETPPPPPPPVVIPTTVWDLAEWEVAPGTATLNLGVTTLSDAQTAFSSYSGYSSTLNSDDAVHTVTFSVITSDHDPPYNVPATIVMNFDEPGKILQRVSFTTNVSNSDTWSDAYNHIANTYTSNISPVTVSGINFVESTNLDGSIVGRTEMDPSVNGNLLVSQSLKSFEDYLHALNSPPIKVWDLDHWQSRHNIELGSTTYSDAKTIFQGHTGYTANEDLDIKMNTITVSVDDEDIPIPGYNFDAEASMTFYADDGNKLQSILFTINIVSQSALLGEAINSLKEAYDITNEEGAGYVNVAMADNSILGYVSKEEDDDGNFTGKMLVSHNLKTFIDLLAVETVADADPPIQYGPCKATRDANGVLWVFP